MKQILVSKHIYHFMYHHKTILRIKLTCNKEKEKKLSKEALNVLLFLLCVAYRKPQQHVMA